MDGRKLSHGTLAEIRQRAVLRVEAGESPEIVIAALGFDRTCIYRWLARYREGGLEALAAKPVPGRPSRLSGGQLRQLYGWITEKNPRQLNFEFALWTRAMIRELVQEYFGVRLSEVSVGRLLRKLGLTPQRPLYRAYQQDPEAVERWQQEQYPAIKAEAARVGATIYFADEAGIRSDFHRGTTWAPKGQTPVVETTGSRFSLNMISAVTAKGQLRFMVVEGRLNGERVVEFLKRLLYKAEYPIFLIVDGHPAHRATVVREFVESTQGKLRLFFLPGYSPELNPDESVWRHLKTHNLGRMAVRDVQDLKRNAMRCLQRLQKTPALIRGFFKAPTLRYAAA